MDKPVKPTYGKYYVRYSVTAFVLRFIDLLIKPFDILHREKVVVIAPKSILLSMMGCLGDVAVSTSVIPILKSAFPGIEIGFLIPKAAASLITGHQDVAHVHLMDHWLSMRGKRRSIKEVVHVLKEINSVSYDIAIELFPRLQNTIPLMWALRIPVRIGYTSGGFGPLLTHKLDWTAKHQHASEWHFDLLRFLPLHDTDIAKARTTLAPCNHEEFISRYRAAGENNKDGYILFHIGAIAPHKKWAIQKWRELAVLLIEAGYEIIFTGNGEADDHAITAVSQGLKSCVNLCEKLSLSGYVAAIENAKLVVCVDTVAQHVAAGFDIPCVVIVNGLNPHIWYPMHKRHRIVINTVSCVPCYRPNACKEMECISGVEVVDVHRAISDILLAAL